MVTARTRRNSPMRGGRRPGVDRHARTAIWLASLSTLVWIPGGFSRFVFAKLLVLTIACAFGALAPRTGRLPRQITWTLVAGAALFTLAALLGSTPLPSLVGRWPRYEGLPMLGLYAAAAWLGARVGRHGTRAGVELERALCWTAWLLFAFSALDAIGISPLGQSSNGVRSGSVLGNATDQGVVAMLTILVLAPVALESLDRAQLTAVAASIGTLAISASRMPMLVTVLGLVAIALGRDRRLVRPVLGAIGVLVVAVLAVPESRDRLLSGATVSGRWLQWKLTLGMVGDHPLLGLGPSRYVDAFGRHETHQWVRFTGIHTYADSPHDVVLQVWLAGGIPLLLAACVLAFWVARIGYHAARQSALGLGLFVAVTGYAVVMLANFTIACSTCLAAYLAGCLLAEAPPPVPDPKERKPRPVTAFTEPGWYRPVAVGVASLASVALLLGCVSEIALQRGMVAAGRGDLTTARHDFATARALRPLDSDVSMLEAQTLAALANRGDRAAADLTAAIARQSLRRTPTTYASLLALGTARLTQNRPADALTIFTRLTDAYPMRPDAFVQRGIAKYGTGDTTGARADLERARWIAPRYRLAKEVLRRLRTAAPAPGQP
ncbi:O-antigen ligase family protein [Nocardioides terrisoli]|uniref:O-antigen ligase family protein n=1 Tax=Nocardioides terrisoli TaxID=3388267 RepID=UPI00287BC1B8|nr:O-antigen ligase family protein [Nocardioides marmorisolisilvae]